MPVLAKFHGIVMRRLCHRTFGTHLHAIYGEDELVIALRPVRVIQGSVPAWVMEHALAWARRYEKSIPSHPQSQFASEWRDNAIGATRSLRLQTNS